jgi:hypothetical protein
LDLGVRELGVGAKVVQDFGLQLAVLFAHCVCCCCVFYLDNVLRHTG